MRVLIAGSTTGTDAMAIALAEQLGFGVVAMKKSRADRKAYPEDSWKGLNARMLATGIDLVLAFHAQYGQPGFARDTCTWWNWLRLREWRRGRSCAEGAGKRTERIESPMIMMTMLRSLFSRSAKDARVGTMTLTLDDLINEGRALERPCLVLRASGPGKIAAVWHPQADSEDEQAFLRQWITIDTSFIPGFDVSDGRFLSVYTDADMSGHVELLDALPVG
jgi:hypothetical protein